MSTSTFLGLPSLFSSNISIYAIIPIWFLGFSAQEIKLLALGTRYNNNKPRNPPQYKPEDSENYKQKIEKLSGMHNNGLEIFPLFVAAVLSANLARLPISYLNSFSLFFLTNRIVYDVIYFAQSSFLANSARTAVYVGGMFGCLWVIGKAAGGIAN